MWEGKKRLKFGAILDNYRLRSRISPEQIHISKIGKVIDQVQPLPRLMKKDSELWPTNEKVIGAHVDPPKLNFSTDYISVRTGCWPLKFLHALEIDQGYATAHPGRPHVGLCPIFLVCYISVSFSSLNFCPFLSEEEIRWSTHML